MNPPTLDFEAELIGLGATYVVGIDEVGRGALAGPVCVGAAVVDARVQSVPAGLADSKLISASKREALIPVLRDWVVAYAIGSASASEIDEVGIVAALRRAALRALQQLPISADTAILDGSHDWLSNSDDLFTEQPDFRLPVVHTRVKADRDCAVVAAASVLAKVDRDAVMVALDRDYPGYGFASNKGYGSASHQAAIATLGASDAHRRSWNI